MNTIEQQLMRIERKLDQLLKAQKKPFWVKAGVITELTGWNNEKMRQARENSYINV